MASLIKSVFKPAYDAFCTRYATAVGNRLANYGLRYDDLYDPLKDEDVAEALSRLPDDVITARNNRLRRAIDLSSKHTYLHGDLLAAQTPHASYLQETLEQVRAERRERAALGEGASYRRVYY